MTVTWRRGEGYTREIPQLPAIPIPIDGVRSPPPPPPGRSRGWEARARTVLGSLAIAMTMTLLALGSLLLAREWGKNDVDRERIERWEDRLDALDGSAVALFDPELSGSQKRSLELRIEHLQRSLCTDLAPRLDEIPGHLRDAYGQVCEPG